MDRLSLFLLSLLLLPYLSLAEAASTVDSDESASSDDLLIRQVVSDGDDHLLNADHHFSLFKTKYGKSYATQEEHDYRLGVFKSNLRRAKRHQILDPSAVHGVTKFSDLTPAEFRHKFLGLKRPLKLPSDAQKVPFLRREPELNPSSRISDLAPGTHFPATLTLERAFPTSHGVELNRLIARDRLRHDRILQSSSGVADFPVEGTYDPFLVGLYFTRVQLGSPPKEFYVQIDTGSDVLWVSCNACKMQLHHLKQTIMIGINTHTHHTQKRTATHVIPLTNAL
ncbi:hypothetical protein CsSME_00046896 [Camellia sinensis var. sinensis]